eukprot:29848-Pelagococcus_subviridis.AAC.2
MRREVKSLRIGIHHADAVHAERLAEVLQRLNRARRARPGPAAAAAAGREVAADARRGVGVPGVVPDFVVARVARRARDGDALAASSHVRARDAGEGGGVDGAGADVAGRGHRAQRAAAGAQGHVDVVRDVEVVQVAPHRVGVRGAARMKKAIPPRVVHVHELLEEVREVGVVRDVVRARRRRRGGRGFARHVLKDRRSQRRRGRMGASVT